jgi:integrase
LTQRDRNAGSSTTAVQVQRWLGHHSAAFTLATYVHLLDGDLGEPLVLGAARVAEEPNAVSRLAA